MDNNTLTKICGMIPEGFVKITPQDANYIFQNDSNFSAINLYNFFGKAATVNSFSECYYYVELGFTPNKITIFDYAFWIGLGLILFITYKKNYIARFIQYLKFKKIIENIKTLIKTQQTKLFLSAVIFIQTIILFDYVKNKTLNLPRFIDEYITLTSHVSFFRTFDFDAGSWLGGNYSVNITSGPISAIGSVIAWNLTKSLTVARMSNFIWVVLIQTIFVYFISKVFKIEKTSFLYLSTAFILILIPWWQGSLYSIGEIPSTLIFINAIFLFSKFRKLSMVLFCIAIVYGKLLLLVPFIGYYIVILFNEKNLKNFLKDVSTFLLTMFPWLTLAHYKYENGNLIDYLIDQYIFITNHQTSGFNDHQLGYFENFIFILNNSEVSNWSLYELIRTSLLPLIFIIILYRNKKNINNYFGNITVPIIFATTFIYLWFWVLNSTKWIRHTQHFTIIVIVSIVYFLSTEIVNKKIDTFILLLMTTFFIDNNKNLIFVALIIYFLLIFVPIKIIAVIKIKYILLLFLFIDISLVYFENINSPGLNNYIEECRIELKSDSCRKSYLNN